MKLSPADNDRLRKAYDEHVERHGRNSAVDAVEKATSQMFVTKVEAEQLDATLAALAKRPSAPTNTKGSFGASHRDRSMSVQDTLDGMAKSIYERR